jgi:hypothetical protein
VAIYGPTAVVGAPGESASTGAAYVFLLPFQQAKLTASDAAAGDASRTPSVLRTAACKADGAWERLISEPRPATGRSAPSSGGIEPAATPGKTPKIANADTTTTSRHPRLTSTNPV